MPSMELSPIVFEMDVHCDKCAVLIQRSLKTAFGAAKVYASPRMSMVVVHGGEHLDPYTLKCFLRRLAETRPGRHGAGAARSRGVTTVSDGGRPNRYTPSGKLYPYSYPYPYPYPWNYQPPPPSYGRGPRWF